MIGASGELALGEIAKAEAAAVSEDPGEVHLDFRRGKDGKITSPVRLSGNVGTYDLAFERGADGRISHATLKPRPIQVREVFDSFAADGLRDCLEVRGPEDSPRNGET
jgi:hypothetical protein